MRLFRRDGPGESQPEIAAATVPPVLAAELQTTLDCAGPAMLIVDATDTILHASLHASRSFRTSDDQAVGRPLLDMTISTSIVEIVHAARGAGGPVRREVQLPGPGAPILDVVAAPVQGSSDGNVVISARDISTDRRVDALRRDFVANVSHELRTPLASIRAIAETLEDGALSDPEAAPRFLQTITREVERLTRLSEDLLTLSAAESLGPRPGTADLLTALNAVVAGHMPRAREADIALTVASSIQQGVRVAAPADQVEQVLLNLVDNALKHTPPGGSIRVEAILVGPNARVTVTDNGQGIPAEHLPRLFERFYRVDRARSRESGGTGLGLAIVRHIAETHGGRVGVTSRLQRGSRFWFELPTSPGDTAKS